MFGLPETLDDLLDTSIQQDRNMWTDEDKEAAYVSFAEKHETVLHEPKPLPPDTTIDYALDTTKYQDTIGLINNTPGISDEFKDTMRLLAQRFIGISYSKIADYYAHTTNSNEIRLLEDMLLVMPTGEHLQQLLEAIDSKIDKVAQPKEQPDV